MKMICPDCGHEENFEALPMKLQTCEACRRDGVPSYLRVPVVQAPLHLARQGSSKVLEERRRLER